ncbi:nuclear transport factor 2 family protein [Streptomyces sp. NPDC054919]
MTLQAADYHQITDVLARSNLTLDQADTDAWVSCFTEDATLQVSDASGRLLTHRAGASDLQRYATQAARSTYAAGATRRWTGNYLITGDRASAYVRSYLIVTTTGYDQRVLATGEIHDNLVKQQHSWLLQQRHVRLDRTQARA